MFYDKKGLNFEIGDLVATIVSRCKGKIVRAGFSDEKIESVFEVEFEDGQKNWYGASSLEVVRPQRDREYQVVVWACPTCNSKHTERDTAKRCHEGHQYKRDSNRSRK